MGGPCGLDNAKVWPVIQTYRRKPQEQRDLLAEVRAFAAGVLSVINKDQK